MGRLDPTPGPARLAFGTVAEVAPDLARVRVALPEEGDDFVTLPLPVLALGTVADKGWWLPDVGEQVAVVYDGAGGVVLGPVYSEAARPVEDDPAVRSVRFSDGTRVEYDRQRSTLTVEAVGPVVIAGTPTTSLGGADGAVPVAKAPGVEARLSALEAAFKAHALKPVSAPAHPDPASVAQVTGQPAKLGSDHTLTT